MTGAAAWGARLGVVEPEAIRSSSTQVDRIEPRGARSAVVVKSSDGTGRTQRRP